MDAGKRLWVPGEKGPSTDMKLNLNNFPMDPHKKRKMNDQERVNRIVSEYRLVRTTWGTSKCWTTGVTLRHIPRQESSSRPSDFSDAGVAPRNCRLTRFKDTKMSCTATHTCEHHGKNNSRTKSEIWITTPTRYTIVSFNISYLVDRRKCS